MNRWRIWATALSVATAAASPALAGGPTGTWTCDALDGSPLTVLEIKLTGPAGQHSYTSTARARGAKADDPISGAGEVEGGAALTPLSGPLKVLGLTAEHRGVRLEWVQAPHATPFMSCTR